ncbi:ankyrin repeat protein [Aspergillus cavernicola]|uniref:Ankyrin repeat protein n=1 Tax=Aspergillus cavernicola TaxID=176166 RepID=A0ABR4IIW7_9EURO
MLSSRGDGGLSPSLPDWASGAADDYDTLDFDLDCLNLSSVDLLEVAVTATRNGKSPILSSVSQFAAILAQTGIHGPWSLKPSYNLTSQATKIGAGAQFTVFKGNSDAGPTVHDGLVIKRVNVPLSRRGGEQFAAGQDYRLQLRSVELEVLALCNPSLRYHPNIVRLVAWGYDYPFVDMPVPVLFMEAALMPLTNFLAVDNNCSVEVKYQLSLDIANGIEALHYLQIVHGDLKPDNVLVFRTQNEMVPFRAKLSDFGVCINLEAPNGPLMMSDYRGTPAWLAPEVANDDLVHFCSFTPDLMFRFDAYSFGLTVLSMFVNHGEPVLLSKDADADAAAMLYAQGNIPPAMRIELRKSIQKFLAEDPRKRPLPAPHLMKADTPAYASWLSLSQVERRDTDHVGTMNPLYNKGPLFWHRLDPSVLVELQLQYTAVEQGALSDFPGSVLFGMAQAVTGRNPSYLDRLLPYLTHAAKAGYSPARAVYGQLMAAHGRPLEFEPKSLEEWMYQAVSEGYLFHPLCALTRDRADQALKRFRGSGGFCTGPFLGKLTAVEATRSAEKALQWKRAHGIFVDQKGNTILHAAAALGEVNTVRALLRSAEIFVDVENDSGETPLYKASQAGHGEVIEILLQYNADASHTTRQTKVSALHWLFMLPETLIRPIAAQLISAGADANAVIHPMIAENSDDSPQRMQILHYPFELPQGTPLHWASFFRNVPAVDALINIGANVNATYHGFDNATTPLALAAWFGDLEVAECLIKHGADGTLTHSKGQNTLHSMTAYYPKLYGHLPHHWHAWIRHGNWEKHLKQTTRMARLLVEAGADINAESQTYSSLTPIATAADLGVWNGGVITALLNAGAELEGVTMHSGNSVLHSWAEVIGSRLDYPCAYIPTLRRIVNAMTNIDVRKDFQDDTPLHTLTTINHPEDEFEEAAEILLAHDPPADLNAQASRGATPLSIAFETSADPARRGLWLLEKGASPILLSDQGKDILWSIANNPVLSDQGTYYLITTILRHINTNTAMATNHQNTNTRDPIPETYQHHFLPNPGAIHTLFAATHRAKLQTTTLLLSLGLRARINTLHPHPHPRTHRPSLTPLDEALHAAEQTRREYIENLSTYKPGPAQRAAIKAQLVFPNSQGPPARAAEAYHAFPEILRCLREAGARRWCELNLDLDGTYIDQPRSWDLQRIYRFGVTPTTQPHRERWQVLYDLERYPVGWLEEEVEEMRELYEMGIWRPDVRFLEEGEEKGVVREVVARIGKGVGDEEDAVQLMAVDPQMGSVEVTVVDGRIVRKGRRRAG